jgi:hypothetical protein
MMQFAEQTGLSVIISHYPPYCSKWNPIEHRLFSQVHRAMDGAILTDYDTVKQIIQKTATKTGLTVVVRLNLEEYPIGIKIDKNQVCKKRIEFHKTIPELNYRITPKYREVV